MPQNLSFLIVNYYSSDLIKRLLNSLTAVVTSNYRVIIINNSPEDPEIVNLEQDLVTVVKPKANLGFGRACNVGLARVFSEDPQAIVWLINPDTYFPADISCPVERAIALLQKNPQIAILGTVVCDESDNITAAGGGFIPGKAALEIIDTYDATSDWVATDWVSGCSLLVNLANFQQCPQFDSRYFLYYEDLDFCLRYGQQGHVVGVTNRLKVIHQTSSITSTIGWRKYRHTTHSYLLHIENHANVPTKIRTHLRMSLNTLRLLVIRPTEGWGKLWGFYDYWRGKISDSQTLVEQP